MEADVGHGVQPLPDGRVDQGKVAEFQTGQEVLFDVADGVLHASLLWGCPTPQGRDGKAVMVGEVLVAGVEHRPFADDPAEHRGLEVIDHAFGGHAAEEGEGVGVAGQEVFHGLRERKLDVQQAAVAEHHDKEAQAAAGVAHGDRTELPPVHLGTLAGGKGQRQEGRSVRRANVVDVLLDDGDAAGVAGLAEAQEDLGGGVGMVGQPADDLRLEGVEFAGLGDDLPWPELAHGQPLGDGAFVQVQFAGDLGRRQMVVLLVVFDLAVELVVDHGARSIPWRTWTRLSARTTPRTGRVQRQHLVQGLLVGDQPQRPGVAGGRGPGRQSPGAATR